MLQEDWKPHVARMGTHSFELEEAPDDPAKYRDSIEPWMTAVLQYEHLSLLVGNGLVTATASMLETEPVSVAPPTCSLPLKDKVFEHANSLAKKANRGTANIEDFVRAANNLIQGLEILDDARGADWQDFIDLTLLEFRQSLLETEAGIRSALDEGDHLAARAQSTLGSFLLSFASRTASKERLRLFTTNYDRLLEHTCDFLGIHVIDRFVGMLKPEFRASRLDIDLHYNPPGIRGEPRYLEGVIRFSKLHGSIDWIWEKGHLHRRPMGFGTKKPDDLPGPASDCVMIYPNPAKDVETLEFPYAELFRDFSSAVCRPNSTLVTYGYGFGDDHINRVIYDMLATPSNHLVIISYDTASGRIPYFLARLGRRSQVSLLIGDHFGDFETLVSHYLPKPAIDVISWKRTELLARRGLEPRSPEEQSKNGQSNTEGEARDVIAD